MNKIIEIFSPNHVVSRMVARTIVFVWIVCAILTWIFWPAYIFPKPGEVGEAFGDLWMNDGLSHEIWTSLCLNVEALGVTAVISLVCAYLTVLPVFRPVAGFIAKMRFLGLTGFTVAFTLMIGGGHRLKLSMLVFGMTVFFVTSMCEVVAAIPKEKFDHARTLRMHDWRVVWEVVVLGTRDQAIEVFRQNAAIGWVMLTMVEGLSRSEGGVGALLLNQNKHFHLAAVFAIQVAILTLGLFQDYVIGIAKRVICPYAHLRLERR